MRPRPILLLAAALATCTLAAPASAAVPAVQSENALPGGTGWGRAEAPAAALEGYSAKVSVLPGEALDLKVRATDRYRVEVWRLGWYGGLGGRRVACVPGCAADRAAVTQPAAPPPDPVTGIVSAGWATTDTVAVDADAVSGYYLAQLVLTAGPSAGKTYAIPFVVRAASPAPVLVQASVNTWQAYNAWGGASVYAAAGRPAARAVSFDRPYDHAFGNTTPLTHEAAAVRWMEREGLDVSYTTDVDVDRDPAQLWRTSLFVVNGHDEYWSSGQRDALEAARDRGQDLLFLGADIGYWQIRYEDDRRTMIAWKTKKDPVTDPALRTLSFRSLGRPECQLLGVQRLATAEDSTNVADYTVVGGESAGGWFSGTGLADGTVLPRLVGYEWDSLVPGCAPAPVTTLLRYQPTVTSFQPAAMTVYGVPPAAPGAGTARVVAAGSMFLSRGLDGPDADPRVQALLRNVVGDLGRPGDTVAPRTTITTPGDALPAGAATFGIASSEPATTVCRLDGGPWGACATSVTVTAAPGLHTLQARATDAAGLTDPTPASVSWWACTAVGTSANDSLTGTTGADVLCGGGGNDVLAGGDGADVLVGGPGDDRLNGGTGADRLLGGDGTDTLDGGADADALTGGDGADTVLYTSRGATQPVTADIAAGTGGGTADGPAGARDTLDTVEKVTGGAGDDTLAATGLATGATLNGGAGADVLTGGAGDDTLTGGDGNDTLDGGAGADGLAGGAGDDIVTYGARGPRDPVTVDLSTTTASGGGALDGPVGARDSIGTVERLVGSAGDDVLSGSTAADVLDGGPGDDTLDGGAGADLLGGGPGADTVTYAGRGPADPVIADLAAAGAPTPGGALDGPTGARDMFDAIERIVGSGGDDVLTGSAADDTLDGGPGDDTLDGGAGADRLTGGTVNDTVTYAGRAASDPVSADLSTTMSVNGSATDGVPGQRDALAAIERIVGTAGADLLTGSAADDTLDGAAGNDTLDGGAGADRLTGGAGSDTVTYAARGATEPVGVDLQVTTPTAGGALDGPAGARDAIDTVERLTGGAGADTLTGNGAANVLTGGRGADRLSGLSGNDTLSVRDLTPDTLVDCGSGTSDTATVDAGLDAPVGCERVS